MTSPNRTSHSAVVEMSLQVNGFVLPILQMGPNFLVLETSMQHPPVDSAQISLSIDGHLDQWLVSLPHGIGPERRKTLIARPVAGKDPQFVPMKTNCLPV